MSKNVRLSIYILIPLIVWMISGVFISEDATKESKPKTLSSVVIEQSLPDVINPKIYLNTYAISEKRVQVRAKTSGEVVATGAKQGEWVQKDALLCKLGIIELNRTEVKAPFDGYIEDIVKPGNLLERGQLCATIIELDPITFIAEVPENSIKDVREGQNVNISLVTGDNIQGKLTFVSKSASVATRTFRVEAEIANPSGIVRDGISGTMVIDTDPVLAHKISPSILLLADNGELGVKTVNSENMVEFFPVQIIQDTEEGIWVAGLPDFSNIIVLGQGFVETGQIVSVTNLASL
ncbi:MAG: efflux RND transporter periplasmic adaptor subunit [Gammaproteobacteria bacterium]|nr:HlyD family efflux transporter periplasmic adaptor subunit [Pseudomonadota bacterium]